MAEIDTLDKFKCTINRIGSTKNWRLLLLSSRDVRGHVDTQAPSVSDCWSNLKYKISGAIDAAATVHYSG